MAGNEKLLKKVAQERSKGQHERALARLKEGIAQDPRDFTLAQEAASLCFELGRALEGAAILRAAMKRCPADRAVALQILEQEFATTKQAELGETLYESFLADADHDRAREVVLGLAPPDRTKLATKLRTKVASVTEEAPHDAPRLVAVLLAEAIVLSALGRSVEAAHTLERVLDLDPAQNDVIGRLCKLELRQSPDCADVHLLVTRCYLNIQKPELAAEHAVAAGTDAASRTRALGLLEGGGPSRFLRRARAQILLADGRFEAAESLLADLLHDDEPGDTMVRHTLEAVPGAARATVGLRLLFARTLARTGAGRLAQKELQEACEAEADPAAALAVADVLAEEDPRSLDVALLRGRLAIGAQQPEAASASFQQVLEADPSRAEKLREEIEAACAAAPAGALGRLLVDLYLQLELPQEAAAALLRLRDARGAAPKVLFDLASTIASRYGLSAVLLLVFVESAIETDHEREARAAVAHYLNAAGSRVPEFGQRLTALLQERPELAPSVARATEGLPLPLDLRFALAVARLEGEDANAGLVEIEALVLERPDLRDAALGALEAGLARRPDTVEALILAGDLCETGGRLQDAAHYLARALRAAPAETDRICKVAERVLRRDPKQHAIWREIVLGLVDVQRHRHARELCYLATQALPPERIGFVHVAQAEMLLESKQQQAAVHELESALACEDAPVERVIALLDRAVEADGRHGYARYVLAAALLRQGTDLDTAIAHLSSAVQQDDLLVDLAFELLGEYAERLEQHAPALLLEGLLHLRKGDRERGVGLLDRAVELQPALASQALPPLEAEWDRDARSAEVGLAFARALRGAGQTRRACRLAADLARRFPDRQSRLVSELEAALEVEPLPEAHRALWEILLERGASDAALQHLTLAYEALRRDEAAGSELLEAALVRMPVSPWVVCRLSEQACRAGREARAEELLRGLLAQDATTWEAVLACVRSESVGVRTDGLRLVEIDCLLAGRQGPEALEGLRRFRDAAKQMREPAIARYRALVEQSVVGVAAHLELGLLLREAARPEEALTALEAGLQRTSSGTPSAADEADERELRLTLASLYVELGRDQEGRSLLTSVFDRPGDHQETYGFLERLARQGMLSKLKSLRETIASTPTNLRARLELARLSIVSMDFEGAREALSFAGDTPAVEAARRYLLARSHADEDHPDLALAVLRSIELDDVGDEELRRNVVYLQANSCELLGQHAEAHGLFLQILSEFPYFKDVRERVRRTYQRHLESALEPRAEVLEKRTHLDVS